MISDSHVIRASAAFTVGGLIAWYWWISPRLVAGRQTRNWAIVQSYVAYVNEYRSEHGVFPPSLAQAIPSNIGDRARWTAMLDNYHRPLHYTSDGASFSIASYGEDGVPDHAQKDEIDPEGVPTNPVCRDGSRDTTYSSNGVVQRCGK